MPTPDAVIAILINYGYFLLFPIAVLEGPIISVIAGFLVLQGYFNILLVYAVMVVADLTGDFLYYGIGRFAKKSFLDKWGHFIGLHTERLSVIEKHFEKGGGKTLLFGKLTHSVGFMILLAAGAARMPLKKFFWFNFLATLPKSLIFIGIGYFFGYAYNQVNSYIEKISLIIFIVIILTGGYALVRKKFSSKKSGI